MLSYDLVEYTFWLGPWFCNFMDAFSAWEVAEKLEAVERVEVSWNMSH
ncbi:MAG: hypothetical protein K2O91_02450 [Lachnospiraceae bacterium]|nr:hypothetical protein [Lachnospiraceae bacterium]